MRRLILTAFLLAGSSFAQADIFDDAAVVNVAVGKYGYGSDFTVFNKITGESFLRKGHQASTEIANTSRIWVINDIGGTNKLVETWLIQNRNPTPGETNITVLFRGAVQLDLDAINASAPDYGYVLYSSFGDLSAEDVLSGNISSTSSDVSAPLVAGTLLILSGLFFRQRKQ